MAGIKNNVEVFDAATVARLGSRHLASFNAGRESVREKARLTAAHAAEGTRMYAGAKVGRLNGDWNALGTSADSEILTSIRLLRARSRQLVRDNEYAKRAQQLVVNNVIGNGIGLQARIMNARGKLQGKQNDQIEQQWTRWCRARRCHTAGKLSFADIERQAVAQLVEAGEVLIRKVWGKFGDSAVPFALEVIEADRLMDQWQTARADNGNLIRMGVEIDTWGRPVAYWLYPTHPGDYQFSTFIPSKFIRLPAEEVIHLYLADRVPQTRGVPWFHATVQRLHNMGGYEEAEIVAARASANIVGFITSPEPAQMGDVENNQRTLDTAPGQFQTLLPGESFQGFAPTRPNAALEPFMRYMLRGFCAGVGISYEALSGDYSVASYSSSRMGLLAERDLWRILQGWFIRSFRQEVYENWLDAAVLSGALKFPDFSSNREKYDEAVRFKPRGWNWIDPQKEVASYMMAVRSGFMTVGDVLSQTADGRDFEDMAKERREELDMMAALKLVFDTDPAQTDVKGKGQVVEPAAEADDASAKPGQSAAAEAGEGATEGQPADPDAATESQEGAK